MSEAPAEPTNTPEQVSPEAEGEFDPERAKALIANLREENKSLKSDRTPQDEKDARYIASLKKQLAELEPKAQQFSALEEASKTELQRQTEALEAANRAREEAQAEALRFRVAAEEGVSKDDLDLLGNGDEEQIRARAVRIAEMRTAAAVAATAATLKPGQRPQEALRPGATPSNEPLSEDEQLYQAIYGPQK